MLHSGLSRRSMLSALALLPVSTLSIPAVAQSRSAPFAVSSLRKAKATSFADIARLTIADRPSVDWIKPQGLTLPAELEDLAWFSDADGQIWCIEPGKAGIKAFGARGDGMTDDTRALFAAAVWASLGYCNHLWFGRGTYLASDGQAAWFPGGAAKREISSIAHQGGSNLGITFIGIDGLIIEGKGGPLIKRARSGCTANTYSFLSWGIFNFKRCSNWQLTGLNFDGNRREQFHTRGRRGSNFNGGLKIWSDCHHWSVRQTRFAGFGTLTDSADKAGDDIYIKNGATHWEIDGYHSSDPGRWGITLERPERRHLDTAQEQSRHWAIRNVEFDYGFNQDGAGQLGSINIEPWSAYGDSIIENFRARGSAKISHGSLPNSRLQIIRNHRLNGISFDLRGSQKPHDADDLIAFGGGWRLRRGGSAIRRYEKLLVENVSVQTDKPLGGDLISHTRCVLSDCIWRNIAIHSPEESAVGGNGMNFSSVWFEGQNTMDGLKLNRLAHGIHFNSWHNPGSSRAAHITIRNCTADGTSWGLRGTLPAFPRGSSFTIDGGNRFERQRARSHIDARNFVAGGGTARLSRDSYFSGRSNRFLGFRK